MPRRPTPDPRGAADPRGADTSTADLFGDAAVPAARPGLLFGDDPGWAFAAAEADAAGRPPAAAAGAGRAALPADWAADARAADEPARAAAAAALIGQAECAPVAPGVALLPGTLTPLAGALAALLRPLLWQAPLRHLRTPGGGRMAVATANAGALGWLSDARGYRYAPRDPLTGRPWPPLPALLDAIARAAAARAGFPGFVPDALLINLYRPGVGLGLHQDRDERDAAWPIVSASLGLPARFRLGGPRRDAPTQDLVLRHGDLLVFGGPARHCFHGVRPLAAGHHPWAGEHRLNLTFRHAG